MARKRVFITGVTGSMGGAGLEKLLSRGDKFDVVTLARPSKKNRKALKPFAGREGIEIVWGDLRNYDDVLKCVTGADIVLHVAALISPEADRDPELARAINVGSTRNIVEAIKSQPHPDEIRLVYIGSVAMTGDRLYPIHVGRTGDPLKPSIFDYYACTKIESERIVAESGLKYWVSLRQTFIAIPDIMGLLGPIVFHMPWEACVEFCTAKDSGLLLANVCEESVPEEFWRRFYNVGGGVGTRVTALSMARGHVEALNLAPLWDISDRNWYALRNFHCHWFEDSDILNDYLNFRTMNLNDHLEAIAKDLPWFLKITGLPPFRWVAESDWLKGLLKKYFMRPMARRSPESPLHWIENGHEEKISAFFKDKKTWSEIPSSWEDIREPDETDYLRLSHGYDESKSDDGLTFLDVRSAASFRGGECVSGEDEWNGIHGSLKWRCWRAHEFEMTTNSVIKGGHWCPQCTPAVLGWDYDQEARNNPFFAQVWHTNHDKDEDNFYPTILRDEHEQVRPESGRLSVDESRSS